MRPSVHWLPLAQMRSPAVLVASGRASSLAASKRVALSGIATYPHAPMVAEQMRDLSAVSWVDWSAQMLGDRRSCLVPPLVGARAFCLGVCIDRSVVGAAGRAYWDCLVAGVK